MNILREYEKIYTGSRGVDIVINDNVNVTVVCDYMLD